MFQFRKALLFKLHFRLGRIMYVEINLLHHITNNIASYVYL